VKALGGVYGYITQSGLPTQLVNLVYLRVSQINGCAYCIDVHSRDLIKEGLAVEKLVLVPAWHEAGDLFDARTRRTGLGRNRDARCRNRNTGNRVLGRFVPVLRKGTGRPDHRDRVDECV